MLLAKKDKDKQVLLAEDQAWMESSSDSDQEINANMVFMAQIEKVLSDSEASSSSADEKISEVGTVADVYIAKRKKKFGQMFAFCRYIMVVNIENLISSLSNIWVGKLRLHANVARFERKMDGKPSYAGVKVKPPVVTRNSHPPGNKTTSYANVAKASCDVGNKGFVCVDKECGDQTQVINIPMSSSQDLPLAVLGCYKDFRSIANDRSLCHSEGFLDVSFKYLGGLWLLFEFNSLEARNSFLKHDGIRSWFSSLKPWHDDFTVDEKIIWLNKRLCIKSKYNQLVFATIFVTLMNVTYAIRVRELCSWTPTFVEINSDREDEEMQSNDGTDVVSVSGLSIDVNEEVQINANDIHDQAEEANVGTEAASQSSVTPMFPPSLSPLPDDDIAGHLDAHHCIKPPDSESSHSSHGVNNKQIGFSMLERLEETIKIGTALGLNMEGCFGDLNKRKWVRELCHKHKIAVYAPQALQDKIALWSSISNPTRNWDGILIALGDFNMGSKMSKLDRFLVSKSFCDAFPHTTGVILEKGISDHRPILLKEHSVDYGPIPFCFFNSWLELDGFHKLIEDTWKCDGIVETNGLEHVLRLVTIDAKIDYGIANDLDFENRRESIKVLGEVDRLEASDLAQKARIMNNGAWIEDSDCVKAVFKDHFSLRFQKDYTPHHPFDINMPKQLSSDQRAFLDRDISREEIKKAVWDCGGDRAPRPDGFTFKIFTTFWDLLESDATRFVHAFFLDSSFPKGCNSSFIALIPKVSNATLVTDFCPISLIGCQYKIIGKILANRLGLVISSCISPEQSTFIKGRNILDGPLILNEVMNWYHKRKDKLMIFKVDFEKPFDSLQWDFLDTIMEKLGFGLRWHVWIKGCFVNVRSSILVNGSPTTEFFVSKGLRQEDPLSPFLFHFGYGSVFFLVSGLRINVHKCSLLGACVSKEKVLDMASIIGCGVATFTLTYLGVPVGFNMALCKNWEVVVNKLTSNLSFWKARLLSVGGRSTLLKSVLGILPTYFMSLYHMPVSIRSKLESLRSNFLLGSDLGERKMAWSIKLKGVDLLSLCRRKLGNGETVSFWDDCWCGDQSLKSYTIASVRLLIDFHFLGANLNATRWNHSIPIKVNVFMWRAMLNKLPTRVNLDRKGIEIDSLLCPICHEDVETVNHIFFTCDLAKVLWALLAKWWELDVPFCASILDWLSWIDSSSIFSKAWVFLDGVGVVLMWKHIADQEVLYDKMSVQLVELDKHVRDLKNTVLEKDFKIFELEECVRNKDLEVEKCLERLNVCENKLHKMGQTNQTVYMMMPSKDNLYNGRKGIGFENPSYFEKAKDLRPTLYDENVIGPGYTSMFLTHSDEALEIEKFKRSRENKIEVAYDYENLNASYVNSESKNQSENDCIVVEKECDKEEIPKVIAHRMFKLSVSQCISPISMSKSSCESNNVEIKLKTKRRKRKSSKQNVKQVNNDVSRANNDFVHFSDLDTFSSVRRPKNSDVIWKEKGSSNTSNVGLYAVSVSNLNKNVKRYSRKDLLACNNSNLGETRSAFVFNNAMNVSCNPRLCDLLDDNNFFIFDDESVKISPVSKRPFRKKPHDSMHIVQICLWIIESGCSKHMTSIRALLTNFVEKFLGTVRFGNNDFAVIAGYGDVVIGYMMIKKVYYVEGLGHNLFSVG
nr:RNA-directed DNA polymerase, eukaryota, reverse transcriptase zinc-binding domain protein [Tanacetum cinerariifolium]